MIGRIILRLDVKEGTKPTDTGYHKYGKSLCRGYQHSHTSCPAIAAA
jgi:hypothetical protein